MGKWANGEMSKWGMYYIPIYVYIEVKYGR